MVVFFGLMARFERGKIIGTLDETRLAPLLACLFACLLAYLLACLTHLLTDIHTSPFKTDT